MGISLSNKEKSPFRHKNDSCYLSFQHHNRAGHQRYCIKWRWPGARRITVLGQIILPVTTDSAWKAHASSWWHHLHEVSTTISSLTYTWKKEVSKAQIEFWLIGWSGTEPSSAMGCSRCFVQGHGSLRMNRSLSDRVNDISWAATWNAG